MGPRARAGRLERRQRRRRRRRHGAVGAGHRHRRIDPPAGRAVRDRGPQADVRDDQPLRDDRLRLVARPGRPAHARRDRCRAAAAPHGRPGPPRLDVDRLSRRDRAADRDIAGGHPPRRARGAHGRGRRHRSRRAGGVQRDAEARRGPRRHRPHLPPAARPARAERLLRARAGRGVVQPRPLRRRALRAARARTAAWSGCTRRPAARASAPRSSAASCSARTRSPAATTTRTTVARSACGRRSPRTSARRSRTSTSSSRRPRRRSPSRSVRRPPTRSRCTSTTTARCRCRWPGSPRSRSPTDSTTACPSGFQLAGPAFSENRILDAAFALESAIGFDGSPARRGAA